MEALCCILLMIPCESERFCSQHAAKKCMLLNKYAIKFQEKLWLTEPLPDCIQGECTIPDEETTTVVIEEFTS